MVTVLMTFDSDWLQLSGTDSLIKLLYVLTASLFPHAIALVLLHNMQGSDKTIVENLDVLAL